MRTSKYIFTIFNFVFLVLSLVLVASGLYLYFEQSRNLATIIFNRFPSSNSDQLGKEFENVFKTIGLVSIFGGLFIFFLSIIGYVGAMQHARVLLGIYVSLSSLLLIAQVATVVYIVVWGKDEVKKAMSSLPQRFYLIDDIEPDLYKPTDITNWFNSIMVEQKCCGIYNYQDFPWLNETDHGLGRLQLEQCCKNSTIVANRTTELIRPPLGDPNMDLQCPRNFTKENSNFEQGCFDRICSDFMIYGIVSGVSIGSVQLLGLVLSILVYRASYYDYF